MSCGDFTSWAIAVLVFGPFVVLAWAGAVGVIYAAYKGRL